MANVIDALVVTLGLDNRQFAKGSADARADSKRTREQLGSDARQIETEGKRAANYFRGLRNEVAGLFLAFAGASTLKDFASSILQGDAATGRLAANLGVATTQLSAWQGALKRVGGDAKDADAAMRSMSQAFQSYQLTGTTGHDADFQGLGVNLNDLQNPANALLKVAEASERMPRAEFAARAGRLGLNDNTINLLSKGRAGVADLVAEQERLGVVTDKDAQAAQLLQDRLGKLDAIIRGAARPQLSALVEKMIAFADSTGAANNAVPLFVGVLGAAAVAATAAYWPFILLAGAIAGVVKGFTDAEGGARRWARTQEMWERIKHGDFKGAAGLARDNFADFLGGGSSNWIANQQASTARYAGGAGGGGGWYESALMGMGMSAEQARGIAAGIHAEGGTPSAVNRKSGAFGIGQWLGPRKRELFRRYGPNPSEQQQLAFLVSELRGGDHGGASVLAQGTADGTLNAYIRNFMRPAAGAETYGDLARGRAYLGGRSLAGVTTRGAGGGGSTSQTTSVGQITIYTPATDAQGIARDLRGAMAQRGLVVQANTGVNP